MKFKRKFTSSICKQLKINYLYNPELSQNADYETFGQFHLMILHQLNLCVIFDLFHQVFKMLELSSQRKHRVQLTDYDYQQDVAARVVIADFTASDLLILEEILYSPLKISAKKLLKNVGCSSDALSQCLQKLASASLLTIQEDAIAVDKERRRYFEFQMQRFQPQFRPDMEFIQGLLHEVPIHLLPVWYSLPRTSSNIFESIVEKYLSTPQIFQRYLADLHFANPTIHALLRDLFSSPLLKLSSKELIDKYHLSKEEFEEIILTLEFHFICTVVYSQENDHWVQWVTPFHEWKEYLEAITSTEAPPISPSEPIERVAKSDFTIVEEMSDLLTKAQKPPFSPSPSPLVDKLLLLQFAQQTSDGAIKTCPAGAEWLRLSLEDRALSLYRNPHNRILSHSVSERHVREAEKSIRRVLHGQWVYFDDFLKGVFIPLHESATIYLRRFGKQWKYLLPSYTVEEKAILKATIFDWLYEKGMVAIGTCRDRECFKVTPFGRFFFHD